MRLSKGMPEAQVTPGRTLYRDSHGRMNVSLNITVAPERLEEYRQGYRCLMCHAAQESAFPDNCIEWYCRYPMKARQSQDLQTEFQGEHDPWPTRREEPEPEPEPGWDQTSSGIVVPRSME